jgi:hypothetical protein
VYRPSQMACADLVVTTQGFEALRRQRPPRASETGDLHLQKRAADTVAIKARRSASISFGSLAEPFEYPSRRSDRAVGRRDAERLRAGCQLVKVGALPTLFAATSSAAIKGWYYGPNKLGETRGYPKAAKVPALALRADDAKRLWDVSEELARLNFGS